MKDKSIYLFDDTNSNVRIGTLNGDLKPDCCNFGSKVFIASGSTLQCYDGVNEVFAVTNAPNAALCFVKDNRVCVCSGFTSDPICYMSGIGDGTFWDDNANDDSAATWVQIGNGGCGIYSATPLSNDIIFFMTNGEIHSLSGSYPDWDMNQIAEDSGVDTRLCSVSVGTDVCFVGKSGLRTVSAVQKYSNIETHDIGDKFDSLITSYYSRPRIWKIDRCRSLFISPNYNLQTIIVYNYNLKAATTISFPFVVVDFFENSSGIVVVSPNSLHFFSREYLTDNGTAIDCSLTTKRTVTIYDKLLVSMVDCSFSASTSGSINFKLHSLETSMSNLDRTNLKINYTVPYIEVTISSTSDVIFNRIALEVTDV